MPMSPDEYQRWTLAHCDDLLGRWVVKGELRVMIQTQREYWATAGAAELARAADIHNRIGPPAACGTDPEPA